MKFIPAFLVMVLVCFVSASSSLAQKNIFGDLNCDGLINEADKLILVDLLAAGAFDPNADLNLDGSLDSLDIGPYRRLCLFALGDGDDSGSVDILDISSFLVALGGAYNRQHDFDGDGDVDNIDLRAFIDALSGTATSSILGDLNGDCLVNDADKRELARLISSGGFDPNADLNLDGSVTLLDIGPIRELCVFSLGDGDRNGDVNILDISSFLVALGGGAGAYDRLHDFDGDGDVDNVDLPAFIKVLSL